MVIGKRAEKSILIVSDEFPPYGGGAGVICMRLAQDFSELGHNVSLVSGVREVTGNSRFTEGKHIQVVRKTLIWPFTYKKVLRELTLNDYDLIVLNDFVSAYLAGRFFSKSLLAKCVVIIHGNDARFVFKRKTRKHLIFGYKRHYSRAIRYCRHIVAVSAYARELFQEYCPMTLPDEKISASYAGVSAADFDLTRKISQEQIGLTKDSKIMFTACRLIEDKGVFVQLDIFEKLSRQDSTLRWLIAGDGDDRARFESQIERRGLVGKVIVLGRVPRSDMAAYYKLANVFWMLSDRDGETMGLVYLEAAMFGVPSIGYEKYGVKEAIDQGRSGFFYNKDSFERDVYYCLTHDMAEGCLAHARKYSTRNFAKHIASLI